MVTELIRAWHGRMLDDESLRLAQGTGIVMGCPLWGEDYVDYFLTYCLPSIMAPHNRAALEAVGCEIVLFVDEVAERRLNHLREGGVRLVRLPDDIVAGMIANPGYKYPLLTAVHNLLIHMARDCGAGFHMLVADRVYSEGYFDGLARLAKEHDAIADTDLVMSAATGVPLLNKYINDDGSLSILPGPLAYMAIEHMARSWKTWTMNGITDFEQMPSSHYIHVRSRATLRVHCAHKNSAWISNARCQKVFAHLGGTVDSELPRYMAGSFYTPKLSDDMVSVSFNIDTGDGQVPLQPWDDYKREFWAMIGGVGDGPKNVFLPYFMSPCEFPAPYDEQYPETAELEARFQRMMEKLYEGVP